MASDVDQQPPAFALTGLMSRGGFSNWVFFFLSDRVVMADLGAAPAIRAGVLAGLRTQTAIDVAATVADSVSADQRAVELNTWCAEVRAKAKRVLELDNADVLHVRLHLRLLANQLFLTGRDGTTTKYVLTKRSEADSVWARLAQRFGNRCEISATPLFRIVHRVAPFLTR